MVHICVSEPGALVQKMACHLFGAKPLPEPCSFIVKWTPRNTFSETAIKTQDFSFTKMHLKMSSAKRKIRNRTIFIRENIVCTMASLLFQFRYIDMRRISCRSIYHGWNQSMSSPWTDTKKLLKIAYTFAIHNAIHIPVRWGPYLDC